MAVSNITPDTYTIHNEDCLLVLASMPDESIDSIVTDPPYLISFMGKDWDSADGIAGQPDVWRECLRVLKPGGHLLAFGATRTYHRMTVAIEDAGFEIRDSIHWTYGSGFPKSLDVSKAIDKAAGAERQDVYAETPRNMDNEVYGKGLGVALLERRPATPDAATWQGWGTALKPSHEPIVVARKPLAGTVAQTVLEYGTGALNIDGTRVGNETRFNNPNGSTAGGARIQQLTPGQGGGEVSGRWPANTILTHSAGCRKTGETVENERGVIGGFVDGKQAPGWGTNKTIRVSTTEQTPVYRCVPGCPVAEMDKQSGTRPGGNFPAKRGKSNIGAFGAGGTHKDKPNQERSMGDTGGASRFFTQCEWDAELDAPFLYVAKPAKKERNAGLDALPRSKSLYAEGTGLRKNGDGTVRNTQPTNSNHHPTVKPVALMRHLCRLVTPPGGVVLDPFTGSGTTGVAAILEGFRFIGIEMTEEYIPIVEARLAHAVETATATNPTLFDEENVR